MAAAASPAPGCAAVVDEADRADEDGTQATALSTAGGDEAEGDDAVASTPPDFAAADFFGWPRIGGPQAVPKRDLPFEAPCPAVRVSLSGVEPLGLIFDCSLPLPVVAGVTPGTQAAAKPELTPGLVLIQVGGSPIEVGARRDRVELLLYESCQDGRVVEMLFEIPGVRRPPSARGSGGDAADVTPEASTSCFSSGTRTLSAPLLGTTLLSTDSEKRPFSSLRATEFEEPFDDARYGSLDGDPLERPEALYLVPRGSAAPLRPGLRFRELRARRADTPPGTTSLPPIGLDGSTSLLRRPSGNLERFDFGCATSWARPRSRASTGTSRPGTGSTDRPETPAHLRAATTQAPTGPGRTVGTPGVGARRLMETKCLSWMAAGLAVPDACYSNIVAEPEVLGPGPSVRWPLHHSDDFICRLSDLERTERVRDAYEVGFKGRKRDGWFAPGPLDPPHERVGVRYTPPRCNWRAGAARDSSRAAAVFERERTARIEDVPLLARCRRPGGVACDACGQGLMQNSRASWFYFCKSCKKHGLRFELCAACHACEVLQGEGKHFGPEIHPHFLRCPHSAILQRKNLEEAWDDRQHILRIFCDVCGHLAGESHRLGGRDGQDSVFMCSQCPDEHGVRFELCKACAGDFWILQRKLAPLRKHLQVANTSGLSAVASNITMRTTLKPSIPDERRKTRRTAIAVPVIGRTA